MDAFLRASNSNSVGNLINDFYNNPEVHGFALDVHRNFISIFREQFDHSLPIHDILEIWENSGQIPQGWQDICEEEGFPGPLSPIFVVIYVTNVDIFRSQNVIPRVLLPEGYAVFLEATAPFAFVSDTSNHRPICGGISVSSASGPTDLSGTLGGFLEEISTGDIYILSCEHVLLNPKDNVVQRALKDGGSDPNDTVAQTTYVVPIASPPSRFNHNAPFNKVDAAIAKRDGSVQVDPAIRKLGKVTKHASISAISLGDDVIFVGKESDDQDATVHRFIARMKVKRGSTDYNFGEVFEITPRDPIYVGLLAKEGDSGSWVVRYNGQTADELCGLLFAGNGKKAICCFIENVLDEIKNQSGCSFSVHY